MSDSNQIIAALHKQADDQLQRDLSVLYDSITQFVKSRGRQPHWTTKIKDKEYNVSHSANWLCFTLMRAAVQDEVREKAVADFMARVATLSTELDEIRAIAEQGQQQ